MSKCNLSRDFSPPGPGQPGPRGRGGKIEIKIQIETRNPLPEQEGITKIRDLSYVVSSPDSFKYECSLDWAQGKDISVEQIIMFSENIFIAGKSAKDTLAHFAGKWKDKF